MTDEPPMRSADAERVAPGDPWSRRYRVFLSYSHADTKWATWLMRRLESFRVPARFHGRAAPIGEVGVRLAPVFRDRDELPTADDLGDAVRDALARSATLVVICSPTAARSRWVNEEVIAFKQLGRSDRVFALIVAGEPNAKNAAEECFPPALRFAVGTVGALTDQPIELIAADARPHADGKDDAFLRLVAGLLGVGFDDLRQRELQRRHRRLIWITSGAVAGMALTAGLAVYALRERDDARRRQENSETVMARMLDDLRTRLGKADRLDALDATGREVLEYFESLNPRDLTDRTNLQQAKALNQIGQMRLAQLLYPEATAAFSAALRRTQALTTRHPNDGEMLFERAQAEYYLGLVEYKQGVYETTAEWWRRYRDSGLALVVIDPRNPKWQKEPVSGYHNLAALELSRGNLSAARDGFLAEHEALEKITMTDPLEAAELQSSLANADSFLGTIAERMGDFKEAVARFGRQIERIETQVNADPLSARMKQRLAVAMNLQADAMAISGQRAMASRRRSEALQIYQNLAAQDAANTELQVAVLGAQVRLASLLWAEEKTDASTGLLREALPRLEKLAQSKPSDRIIVTNLANAWRLSAQMGFAGGGPPEPDAAGKALNLSRAIFEKSSGDETNLGAYAQALILAGVSEQRRGEGEEATRHWMEAGRLLEAKTRQSTNHRVLDPAVRVLALLHRESESRALRERLDRFGYLPLEPWPAEPAARFSSVKNQP
jgi:tetratricopeptide (TPR) repeat protein